MHLHRHADDQRILQHKFGDSARQTFEQFETFGLERSLEEQQYIPVVHGVGEFVGG